ncbi:hypothetical protein [Hymenobacter negativus]|uniref:DUF3592 domain-containing protein n=1 Tax=Hymenobacter negativus TaxID=2795026 RepID=A0ABS3Q9H3_9BACT|nr:hypothetical protein [Hymenobacter negativus]MBO2007901.1 hypothetical protein [Hymenobacter negativus]
MPGSAALPVWLAWPCGAAFLLGIYGLGRGIGWATRLFSPEANAFAFPAAQDVFRFTLTAAGAYELSCTRPGRWGTWFTIPDVEIRVRRLPDGPVQRLQPSFWNWSKRTNMDGDTTQRIADFVADLPGEYELINPYTTQFLLGDKLRILPSTSGKTLPLVLLLLVSGLATISGFVVGLIAGIGGLTH